MKKLITIIIALLLAAVLFGEDHRRENSPLTLEVGGGSTLLDGEPVISLDGQLSFTMNSWLDLGLRVGAYHTPR